VEEDSKTVAKMLKTQVVTLVRDREERRKAQDQAVLESQQQQQRQAAEQIQSVIGEYEYCLLFLSNRK
jgi:hypothetical protein